MKKFTNTIFGVGTLIAGLANGNALAQDSPRDYPRDYPTKPILFVIPFAAGGDSGLSGRNAGHHASKHLNNKPIGFGFYRSQVDIPDFFKQFALRG